MGDHIENNQGKGLTLIIDYVSINLDDVILMGSIMAKVSSSLIVVKDHYTNAYIKIYF